MDEQKNCIFVARKEFTTILVYVLYPAIYQGLKSIWEDAKRSSEPRQTFAVFQNKLTRVRKWNQDVIEAEYKRIVDKTECYYLEDLIKRVFVLNTQILAAVNMAYVDPNRKIKVKVPKGEKFVHHCYQECARAFWENAPLMEDRPGTIPRVEQLKNLQKSYKLIMTCIENTIRNMLPIESLLKNSLNDEEGEDATPPAMLFQNMTSPLLHKLQPASNPSLSAFPTVNNFLNAGGLNPSLAPGNIQPPSLNSLQPSMTDLGTIPLPAEMNGGHATLQKSDANELFKPDNTVERKVEFEERRDDDVRDNDHRRDDNHDRDDDHNRENNDDNNEDRRKSNPFSLSAFLRNNDEVDSDYKRDEDPQEKREENRPNTKTIFFQGKIPPLYSKPEGDHDSEDSDGIARNKDDIGGNPYADVQEAPVVKSLRNKSLDLDVFSSNNELPLGKSRFEEERTEIESTKGRVPPINHDEQENFFSDVD